MPLRYLKCSRCGCRILVACPRRSRPPPGSRQVYCSDCKAKERQRNRLRRHIRYMLASCCGCGAKETATPAPDALCMKCWLKKVSRRRFGTNKYWAALLDLWDSQLDICVKSGVTLHPGVNAKLEYITPIALGGEKTVENVVWVDTSQ